jgi:DNA-binding response OmpR family regulator
MKKILIISPSQYLAEALQSSEELAGYEIVTGKKILADSIVITDNGSKYQLGEREFIKPVKLADLIGAIKSFTVNQVYELANIKFDPKARKLIHANQEESLTETENAILLKLAVNHGEVTIDQILSEVLGYDQKAETNTVETHIYRLRQKIRNLTDAEVIATSATGYFIN